MGGLYTSTECRDVGLGWVVVRADANGCLGLSQRTRHNVLY